MTLHELTEDGNALRPILVRLVKWGMRRLGDRRPDDSTRPGWLLAARLDSRGLVAGETYQLEIGTETFSAAVGTTVWSLPLGGQPARLPPSGPSPQR